MKNNNLKIALPKGRMGNKVYTMFSKIGLECGETFNDSRKLVFHNDERKVSYFLVKPSDVGIYVERGAADIGVIGKDILIEQQSDVFELLDLKLGKCSLSVAALKGYVPDTSKRLTVATKYVNTAKNYYACLGQEVEVIKLGGSIELAACLGLANTIVDIVESGATIRENGLEVIAEIALSSARLISNKISFKFKNREITKIVGELEKTL
ncbi:MAG: ATP phosphoribosyltransferase [Oscillospiraceae bacterium]|nr:ATP phosphoribosyltransferase [Oscillospiraceae bacterium]